MWDKEGGQSEKRNNKRERCGCEQNGMVWEQVKWAMLDKVREVCGLVRAEVD